MRPFFAAHHPLYLDNLPGAGLPGKYAYLQIVARCNIIKKVFG
jgi:hypothetical protein